MFTLQTPRLLLRSFAAEDLDVMAEKNFMRFAPGLFSRKQTPGFLDKMRPRDRTKLSSQFGVIFREDNRLIEYCGSFPQVVDDIEELEIGYRLDPFCWGRGLATEAARAIRDHDFQDLQLPRLISLIHPENVASRRVAGKKTE